MIDARLELEAFKMWVGGRCLTLQSAVNLAAGETYLLVGPSGIGKSSFARVLLGLHACVEPAIRAEGKVRLVDASLAADSHTLLDGKSYRRHPKDLTAVIPQLGQQGFIDELSAEANLALFSRLSRSDFRPKLETMAAKLRLWPLPTHVSQASGGEKMRLGVLRAMLPRTREGKPPVLLIADEPTVGLDDRNAEQVVEVLRSVSTAAKTVTLIITHEPFRFTSAEVAQSPNAISIIRVGDETAEEVGRLVASDARMNQGLMARIGSRTQSLTATVVEAVGAIALSPLALLYGIVRQNLSLLRTTVITFVLTSLNWGTIAFVCSASVFISLTLAIFLFHLLPSKELIEPLILSDLILGLGIILQVVLIPLMASLFAVAKNGAAQSARLASSVRTGLLDTLTMARIPIESYALAPSILGQIASLFISTAVASFLGLVVGGAIIVSSGVEMGISQVLSMMYDGMDGFSPGWLTWVVVKLLASGFIGGTLAAWIGTRPNKSEKDVALAVRRTLLWSMFAVLAIHCVLVIAQFSK